MKAYFYLLAALVFCFFLTISSRAADTTPPTIMQIQPAPGTVTALTQITVTFSEDVTGVNALDFLINGEVAVSVEGSEQVYTFRFDQPAYGTVQISWDNDQTVIDSAGNHFNHTAPGATWQYTLIDTVAPVVANLSPAAGTSVRQLSQIQVDFSEPVTGVNAGDLLINGVAATNVSVAGAGKYLFKFAPQPAGSVTVAWAGNHQIADFASPGNAFAGGSWNYTVDPAFGAPDVRINEFIASNISGLLDEDRDNEDWIEIQNRSSAPVNLAGWSLTDDAADPGKWVFPATNVAPGKFVVVFASGKDRRNPASTNKLHTNFQLNASGNYLALFNGESPRQVVSEFAPQYPEQRNDYSYGYDAAGNLRYFSPPTPGATNGTSQLTELLPPPHFNVERGLYDSPFTLYITCEVPGATIRYTTDGSEPTVSNGILYSGPFQITNTSVIRALSSKPDMVPSATITHTYVFVAQVLQQPNNPPGFPTGATIMGGYPSDYEMDPEIVTNAVYGPQVAVALKALPTVSIATSIDGMFGPTNGIYTHASDSTTLFRGRDWERACSMEFMPTNGGGAFQANCGIRIQGNASRNPQKTPKHPFRLIFRSDYGPGRLQEKVFPDSPATSFNTLVMRADFNNSWLHWDPTQRSHGTRIRDAVVKDTWRAMGHAGSHSRYFHLYINGVYWGIYDFGERIDATFAANYMGGEATDYDAIASKPTVAIDGDISAYNAMRTAALKDQTVVGNYTAVLQLLDVNNFADYMLLNFYGANQDWGNDSNWNAVRRRPDGKFKYICWDGEQLLVGTTDNRVSSTDVPGGIHTSLVNSPEYRLTFADRAHKHLFNDGALATNVMVARWAARMAEVDLPMVAESARWGDYRRDVHQYQNPPYILYTRNSGGTNWVLEVNRLLTNYFIPREQIFLGQLRAAGLYPNVSAPVLSQHGGHVARNYGLTITASNQIYYTLDGSDPREYGTSAVAAGASLYSGAITLSNSVIVRARALFNGTNWSAMADAYFAVAELSAPLRITEIMYNPTGGDAYEFLELKNIGAAPLDVGGYSLGGVTYVFPPNTILASGQTIVLASSSAPGNWAARYPGVTAFGYFDGSLSNGGEKISIKDAAGNVIYSVDYDDDKGWPKAADGSGYSLEMNDMYGDPDDPANWRASAVLNGTPGTISTPPALGAVVLNELMATNISSVQNSGTYPDWIELRNTGGTAVDISGWSLTDDGNTRKFVFPGGTSIAANGYFVVWCDTNATPGLHAGFALDWRGQTVSLYNASTTRVDAVTYGLQIGDYSVGRVNGAWTLTTPTPNAANAANAAVTLASTTNLVINEWLADAPPGADDWVELFNKSSSAPVSLDGIYLGTGNTIYQISSLSFVPPLGFAQLFATGSAGPDQLEFNLSRAGGNIVLYDESATERDRVTFGLQTEGVTEGRYPDGSATIRSFPGSPSPRASNYVLNYTGPVLNEVMAINNYTYTNSYGEMSDWIELYNPTAAVFDLSGMRLTTDLGKPTQWVFPAGTTISSYLIILFDDSHPASTSAGPVLNTGHSLDGDSGQVYLLNAAGQPVDWVTFGFQIGDRSIGRSSGQWKLLASPTPGTPNSAAATLGATTAVRINEWMAEPLDGNDWFELYNGDSQPVALDGLWVTDHPSFEESFQTPFAPLSFIGGKGFVKVLADDDPSQGRNHVGFNLDGDGEALRLFGTAEGIIDSVYFGPQALGVSEGRLPDGAANFADFPGSATPAASNYLPLPNAIINEVLTSPTGNFEQAIEIYNPSSQSIDISGWFLSNQPDAPKKFRIADGTVLAGGGYLIFYGNQLNFAFDAAHGGQVRLSEADAIGNLSGRAAVAAFGPAVAGKSSGAVRACVGTDFVELTAKTFGVNAPGSVAEFRTGAGAYNSAPRVGPIVISEIMYHPPNIASNENTADEYIELHNISGSAVVLSEPGVPGSPVWRLRNAIQFDFPASTTILAGGYLLLVNFDPADATQLSVFRARYGVAPEATVLGPLQGNLSNGGETIELYRPQVSSGGLISYGLVERVTYDDAAPWPAAGDGDGNSLQRIIVSDYGNDPLNWQAAAPTPGRANATSAARVPQIIVQPLSRGVLQNAKVEFNVTACGTAPLSYQWQFNGSDMAGQTAQVLTIPNVTGANTGSYRVRVSNGAGSVFSDIAMLNIMAPPTITQQPQNQTIASDTNAVFSVTVSGQGPFTYQWRANGFNMPGETNSTLVLANVQAGQTGDYSVVVANAAGAVASAVAHLDVFQRARILTHPQPRTVNAGATTNFTVSATGAGTLRYQWIYFGAPISGATNATLTLSNIQVQDSGDYAAIVYDDRSSVVSSNATLTVLVRPTVTRHPASLTVAVGSNATLQAAAIGGWPMSFRWRRNALNVYTDTVQAKETNSFFPFPNIQTNQAGTYNVGVVNAAGNSSLSSNAFLTVVIPPTNQFAAAGSNATFNVTAITPNQSIPNLARFQWQFNGTNLPNATNASLALNNVQPSDAGPYSVVITLATNNAPAPATFSANLLLLAADTDGDGIPDDWETAHGLDSHNPDDAAGDLDGDHMSNLNEYIAGTDPQDPQSYLKIEIVPGGSTLLQFKAIANKSYSIEYKSDLDDPAWSRLTNVDATPSDHLVQVSDNSGVASRYYRLRTPKLP